MTLNEKMMSPDVKEKMHLILKRLWAERDEITAKGFEVLDEGIVQIKNPWAGPNESAVEVWPHVAALVDYIYGYGACENLPFTQEEQQDLLDKFNWARMWIADHYPDVYMKLID